MKHTANRRRGVSTRAFVALLALVLVIGCVAGGTVAWLVSAPAPVTNTFTYGDININLTETKPAGRSAKIIPGVNIEKDPKVTVEANSEACWLFVKVETTGTFVAGKVTYSVRTGTDGWTQLMVDGKPVDGVYYREVNAADAKKGADYYVLTGSEQYPNGVVTVSENLTKGELPNPKEATLKFTAYAVQKDNVASAEAAWAIAKPTTNP